MKQEIDGQYHTQTNHMAGNIAELCLQLSGLSRPSLQVNQPNYPSAAKYQVVNLCWRWNARFFKCHPSPMIQKYITGVRFGDFSNWFQHNLQKFADY